jgi:hypothetical protein
MVKSLYDILKGGKAPNDVVAIIYLKITLVREELI